MSNKLDHREAREQFVVIVLLRIFFSLPSRGELEAKVISVEARGKAHEIFKTANDY